MSKTVSVPHARDLMTTSVVSLRADMPVLDAVAVLTRRGFSGAPIVDADRRVVGVLSEGDALEVLADAAFHDLPEGSVGDRMSREVETVSPDADVFELVTRFRTVHVKRLPVVEDGRLVGLVTRRDVMDALSDICRAVHPYLRRTTMDALMERFGRHDPTA